MTRRRKQFGYSRGSHAERARLLLGELERKIWTAKSGSCVDRLKAMRQLERTVAQARSHSVASGAKSERVLLPKAHRFDKQLQAAWSKWHQSCEVKRRR